MRQRRLHVALLIVLAPLLLGLALIIPQAIRLDQPWDIATLRQPNEIKHRVVAIMSGLTEQPRVLDDMQPIANTAEPSLGVNTFFEQEVDEATVRRSMEMISDAGFQWIRQQFAWYEIERPAKGEYVDSATDRSSWDKYDRIVRLADEYGLSVLVRIDTVPDWARPTGSTFTHPPTHLEDYGDFVHTLVTRYRDSVHYYQLWNEPNLGFEWGNQNVKASEFVPLLKAGYTAVKAADADAVVIAAALAPTMAPGRTIATTRSSCRRCTRPAPRTTSTLCRLWPMASSPAPMTGGSTPSGRSTSRARSCCARSWTRTAMAPSQSGSRSWPGMPCHLTFQAGLSMAV